MSSEDPATPDQPPGDVPGGEGTYGSQNPYGTPGGSDNPYAQPSGSQPPYGAPSYQQPTYEQPTYQQPSGYPPPPPWGQPQQPGGYPPGAPGYGPGYTAPDNDGLALGAMIVGIVSLVLACGYGVGLLGSPVALVMGRVSMKRIDRSGGRLGGRGMAQTGFILGIIGTVLLVLALIALVIVIVVAVNGGFDNPSQPSYQYNS